MVLFALFLSCGDDDGHDEGSGQPGDPEAFAVVPRSCVYLCGSDCVEDEVPYDCPSLGSWKAIPHAETCELFDGRYPDPVQGQCVGTEPTGEAIKYAGPDPDVPGGRILPDGRPTRPNGRLFIFDEPDMEGGLTTGLFAVPGTPLVLTVDSGIRTHVLRVVDTSLMDTQAPVVGHHVFQKPEYLSSSRGVAILPPERVFVATSNGSVRVLTLETAAGTLQTDDARSIPLPERSKDAYFASSVALTPDGTRLVVTAFNDTRAAVYDITDGPSYGEELGTVDLGSTESFGVWFDPLDADGRFAYASMLRAREVVEIDLADPGDPQVSRRFLTDKNPQGIAFLDARWMVAVNDLGETLSLIDRSSGEVHSIAVEYDVDLEGLDSSSVAFDAVRSRLYVALSGINTVAAYEVDFGQPVPMLKPVGRLATGWWPSAIALHDDGGLSVTTLRGWGAGPVPDGIEELAQRGGVQHVPAPSLADLAQGEEDARRAVDVSSLPGYPRVECPPGVDDFPIPATNTQGPSKHIRHVFFVVRENKTFDGVFGDMPGVKGEPAHLLRPAEDMDLIWGNLRKLAKDFAHSDNSYTDADASVHGHAWTTFGRTTDYCERMVRNKGVDNMAGCGVADTGRPEEGSVFDWLHENGIRYDMLGEIVGQPSIIPSDYQPIDVRYPGGPFQSIGYPDTEKSCHVAGRARVLCDLNPFIYMTLPNDHGAGVGVNLPTPTLMIAVNDEATGMLVDAISHSPLWPSSLIIITEDDPQQGGDHVDYHRVPFVMVSPWVKRGYVSKTHMSVPGVYKILAHVYGLPYPNVQARHTALPFDFFTSTPDYTPYEYMRRVWPMECGTAATSAEQRLTESWDYDRADDQPGIDAQVVRWLRGEQLTTLPPELEDEVLEREQRRVRRRLAVE